MRLIDADEVMRDAEHISAFRHCLADLSDLAIALSGGRTIEAEPVRHGRWEHIHEGVYLKVRCTACGVDAIKANTYVYDTRGLLVKWAYCPNCGAKMEGELK